MSIKDAIFALTHPSHWQRNHPTCEAWDEELNRILDQYPVRSKGSHTAEIGPVKVWVANYPYACGSPLNGLDGIDVLPRRRTV